MNPEIGVVMAVYNGERYIRDQIVSVLTQSRKPDQIIIIDDGSCDRTTSIIGEFVRREPARISLIRNAHNIGAKRTFEKGISLCTANYIALCDQDDVWEKEKLEKLSAVLDDYPNAKLCFHDLAIMDGTGNSLGHNFWANAPYPLPVTGGSARKKIVDLSNPVPGNTMLFSSELKSSILPMPASEWIGHDWWISAIAFFLADPVFVSETLVRYRLHDNQTAGIGLTINKKKCRGNLPVLFKVRREVKRLFVRNSKKREQRIRQYEMSMELLTLLEKSHTLHKVSPEEYSSLKNIIESNLAVHTEISKP